MFEPSFLSTDVYQIIIIIIMIVIVVFVQS